jgi:hypothetical protein
MSAAKTELRASRVHKQNARYKREAKRLGLRMRFIRDGQGLTWKQRRRE